MIATRPRLDLFPLRSLGIGPAGSLLAAGTVTAATRATSIVPDPNPAKYWLRGAMALASPGRFADVSFSLHAGEVLGLASLVGAGRSKIALAIFGLASNAVAFSGTGGRIELACAESEYDFISEGRVGLAAIEPLPVDTRRHAVVTAPACTSIAADTVLKVERSYGGPPYRCRD